MSCVHYKYKNSLDYDTITFDGLHITLNDLRQSIAAQKKLGKSSDFLLQVINAQTKEEYKGDNTLIPRNASVIVQRVPVAAKGVEDSGSHAAESQTKSTDLSKTADLVKAVGSEEEKVKAMMTQSTGEYDPSKYQRVRHRGPSSSYICFRCNKPGHHIRNCPMNGIKRATGIPQIFMVGADSPDVPGAMLTASGQLAVPVIDSKAYAQGKKATDRDFPAGAKVAAAPVLKKVERNAPEEMICPLCRKLMTDAVLIPCCGRSYCDDCIRNYLLENKFICPEPDCKQTDVSPDNLIPNRSLRKAIDNFRNGVVGAKGASALKAAQVEADQKPTDEKPSDQKSSSEKEVIKSEESQSKNEGNRKKSPAAGDASRDSTPEPESVPLKPPTSAPSSQPWPDRPVPPPVGVPMVPPVGCFMPPPPPVPMYAGMVDGPIISYPPVMPPVPVPVPMSFPGPQGPFPGHRVVPTVGMDPGHINVMDDRPPMSAEEFYRQQVELRKRMGYSSSSCSPSYSSRSSNPSSQWSSQSRSSSWSRSRSPSSSRSRSLSHSPKRRHRSKRYRHSRSRSVSVTRKRRRHRSSPSHKHQSRSHHSSKYHRRDRDSPRRTVRHRRRKKSVSRSRTPVRRASPSPHHGGSQSASRTRSSHKSEHKYKHRKRSRSSSPTERVPKKEKVIKHSRELTGESAHSGKDTSKTAETKEMQLTEAAVDPVKVSESVADDGQSKGKMKKKKHHKHHKHRRHSGNNKPQEAAEVNKEETGDSDSQGGTEKLTEETN